jgi:hypothetical protein
VNKITAIDILVEPDATALARATAVNARLRAEAPEGLALDESHRPHITLLQRYVWTAALDAVFADVDRTRRAHDPAGLGFRATGIRHMPLATLPGSGIAGIVATPEAAVLELQRALIAPVAPYTTATGTADAFETTPGEPDINRDTVTYVERYVPDHSGGNFLAHLTVGVAPLPPLARPRAEHFDSFTFHPSAIAVFKLGNNGTARRQLAVWQTPSRGGRRSRSLSTSRAPGAGRQTYLD